MDIQVRKLSPAAPVVTTHLRIIKRILRALKPNARNLPNNIVVLKSPLDLAMYHVTCPLPSSVWISGSVKFAGHSRRQCCRGVLHHKGVEVRPVLRVGEAGCRCQYCQSNPVRQHVQQKTKQQFYNVNLQWGIQKKCHNRAGIICCAKGNCPCRPMCPRCCIWTRESRRQPCVSWGVVVRRIA